MTKNKSVLLGFSGGVDSSVSAYLLKQQGFDVVALYFEIHPKQSSEGYEYALAAAKSIETELIYKNLHDRFEELIISYFCGEYSSGRTPTPCVFCNPLIKFDILKKTADELDIPYIATGHYAGVAVSDGIYYPALSANSKKDQSYMLCRLGQDVLKRLILPLKDFQDKADVRSIASVEGFLSAQKKDSQDLCFVPDSDHISFLRNRNAEGKKGLFRFTDGRVIKEHDGLAHYTPGQRKGLNIAAGYPAYVVGSDVSTGDVFIGTEDELYKSEVVIDKLFFCKYGDCCELPPEYDDTYFDCKLRYSYNFSRACLKSSDSGSAVLVFDEPQRAPAPGQAACLYRGGMVIGSGIIK